jgi:hypothetical protein
MGVPSNGLACRWVFLAGLFLLVWCLGGTSTARAADSESTYAVVHRISGQVTVTSLKDGTTRNLQMGDSVRVGEQLSTVANSEVVLRADDASVIAMRPNAKLVMEAYRAHGKQDDAFNLRLFSGALRLLSGAIAGRNRDNYWVKSPTATIGVRGTDYEPYVLTKAVAQQFGQPEGTYDKVNQGATTLEAHGATIEVSAGQVGFVPTAAPRVRGLMTVLMPVLLERVPGFYVPGQFDHELQAIATGEQGPAHSSVTPGAKASTMSSSAAAPQDARVPMTMAEQSDTAACRFNAIANQWLGDLDAAIVNKDSERFVQMFDAATVITAEVVTAGGQREVVRLDRDGLAQRIFTSLRDLQSFKSRRPVTRARLESGGSDRPCNRIEVQSLVIESGMRSMGSYRIESVETFVLERQANGWVAVRATTRQQ